MSGGWPSTFGWRVSHQIVLPLAGKARTLWTFQVNKNAVKICLDNLRDPTAYSSSPRNRQLGSDMSDQLPRTTSLTRAVLA